MRIRWRDFEIPNSVVCEEESKSATYGKFFVEPFERGFGVTVGNSLRRILLSSLQGSALVSAKIEGVQHEFTSMTGVFEDVTDIVLNLKGLLLSLQDTDEAELRIHVDKKGPVTGADVECGPEAEVVNKDLHIATLTQDIPFNVELRARRGRGYSTSEENSEGDNEIGIIWIDSAFSPVRRVRYKTENTRVGQRTNYDRLILEIWTDGTVSPQMTLVEASKILRRHLSPFIHYAEIGYTLQHDVGTVSEEPVVASPDLEDLRRKLDMPISVLDLSVRAYNCLDGESIATVGELVQWTEPDLLKVRNFGKTTLVEIQGKLEELSLSLGLEVPALEGSAGNLG